MAPENDFACEVDTEAYVYALTMVMMEMTRRVSTNVEVPISLFAPMNQFAQKRALPESEECFARYEHLVV